MQGADVPGRAGRWRALLGLVWRAGRWRAAALAALVLAVGLLPTAAILLVGALARAIPAAAGPGGDAGPA
ncbi:MAG TPA: hypothetical protein VFZ20_27385, partial [Longimicrobium sp.]